mmetsp:Transcript_23304/g.80790  ORF Transcript_23304/g.80790 Transcript_23304/m.80790 type:complete len:554 (-) Transcript_23304:1055-2716(-)
MAQLLREVVLLFALELLDVVIVQEALAGVRLEHGLVRVWQRHARSASERVRLAPQPRPVVVGARREPLAALVQERGLVILREAHAALLGEHLRGQGPHAAVCKVALHRVQGLDLGTADLLLLGETVLLMRLRLERQRVVLDVADALAVRLGVAQRGVRPTRAERVAGLLVDGARPLARPRGLGRNNILENRGAIERRRRDVPVVLARGDELLGLPLREFCAVERAVAQCALDGRDVVLVVLEDAPRERPTCSLEPAVRRPQRVGDALHEVEDVEAPAREGEVRKPGGVVIRPVVRENDFRFKARAVHEPEERVEALVHARRLHEQAAEHAEEARRDVPQLVLAGHVESFGRCERVVGGDGFVGELAAVALGRRRHALLVEHVGLVPRHAVAARADGVVRLLESLPERGALRHGPPEPIVERRENAEVARVLAVLQAVAANLVEPVLLVAIVEHSQRVLVAPRDGVAALVRDAVHLAQRVEGLADVPVDASKDVLGGHREPPADRRRQPEADRGLVGAEGKAAALALVPTLDDDRRPLRTAVEDCLVPAGRPRG